MPITEVRSPVCRPAPSLVSERREDYARPYDQQPELKQPNGNANSRSGRPQFFRQMTASGGKTASSQNRLIITARPR
jgi:hypothetical protein